MPILHHSPTRPSRASFAPAGPFRPDNDFNDDKSDDHNNNKNNALFTGDLFAQSNMSSRTRAASKVASSSTTSLSVAQPSSTTSLTSNRDISPAPMSTATSLPVVNFGFEELRDRMNRFTIRFDEFLEKGRKRLLTEKNDFARDMAEARESARDVRAQIDHLKAAEQDIAEQMAREREEALEAERAIASMARTKAAKTEHRNALLAQIAHTETLIANKRSLRATERSSLLAHSSLNAPELEFWENYLGMRIESAGVPDHLRIVFTQIVENDWDREFRFVVALGPRDYQVLQCRPKVPDEVLNRVVGKLNESRNLTKFWKDMRDAFKDVAKREGAL